MAATVSYLDMAKSLCYQLLPFMFDFSGMAVPKPKTQSSVVQPLLSLMVFRPQRMIRE